LSERLRLPACLISYRDFDGMAGFPTTWIVLDAPVTKWEPEDVKFSVHSYGQITNTPPFGKTLSRLELQLYFFGYVSAGPM